MSRPRKYSSSEKSRVRRPFKSRSVRHPNRLRPGVDVKLKKIFSKIGRPAPSEFVPDPFQLKAVKAAGSGDCLVTAPTGSGKTWIAQEAMADIFENGGRVWYATPLKALSNAKLLEFAAHFGAENVGILTGDRKENPDAPIIVGTTEILRNQLYDAMHHGQVLQTDFVVLDEAHYLGDTDRGVVWEETMIYLPRRIPLLMLSATIGNARQIADWLTSIRDKPCRVLSETKRPVPLYPLFLHPSGTLHPLLVYAKGQAKARLYKKVSDLLTKRKMPRLTHAGGLPPFGDLLTILRKYNLLPALFFLKSRADCDRAIRLCMSNTIQDPQRAAVIRDRIQELVVSQPHIKKHRQRWLLEQLAVGSHHSGQLPAWKQVLEMLMSEGHLDAIFATSTVAAGVDFPARTVAFLNSDRFNGREFVPLDSTELQQMTGRSGRRGKDHIGFALVIPGKYMDVRRVAHLFRAPPAPVHSQIRINFSMTLNLLLSHTPEKIKELLQKSLAAFQRHGDQFEGPGSAYKHLWKDFQRHLTFLKQTGFVDATDRLTEDGMWASKLRIDQPLLVAEGLRRDLFPTKDPALLAALMASFVNEKETDEHLEKKRQPKQLVKTIKKVTRGLKGFAKQMQANDFEARPLFYRPAVNMWAWANGRPWDQIIKAGGMAEGDMAMMVLRTADHLRHIKNLEQVFASMSTSAKQAIELILRDPVMPERGAKQGTSTDADMSSEPFTQTDR